MRNLILIILLVLVGCAEKNYDSISNWNSSKCYGRYYDGDYRGLSNDDIYLCEKLYRVGCDYYANYINGSKYDSDEYYTRICGENYVVDGDITQDCLDTIELYIHENTIDCYQSVVNDYNIEDLYNTSDNPILIVIDPELLSYNDVRWDSDSNYYITSKKYYGSYYRTRSPIIMLNNVRIYIMERF